MVNNEPAFGIVLYPGSPDQQSWPGLTKREYLSAFAPKEIPGWFIHIEPQRNICKKPTWQTIENEEDRKEVKQWQFDPIYDLPDHLQWFSDKVKKHYEDLAEWERQNTIARYFQWRVFYADQLLAHLSNPQP